MPRISGKRRVEDDISEYLLEMAETIEMADIQPFDSDSDNEILDLIDASFDDPCYLEESESKPRYYRPNLGAHPAAELLSI